MRFIKAVAFAVSTLTGLAVAQSSTLAFTDTPASVTAGTPVTIKYSAADESSPATIILRKGDPDNLNTISVLTSSATNGTYTWIPADSIADGTDYALEITQGDSINYSGEFSLSGANPAAVSSASAATASASAYEASITSSVSASSAIASIQSVIASYNASLTNLTATTSGSTVLPASASLGTGTAMSRNATMSSATLTSAKSSGASSGASTTTATTTGGSGSAGTSGSATGGSATGTSASASSTASGAATAVSGSSPLALVLCAFAAVVYLK